MLCVLRFWRVLWQISFHYLSATDPSVAFAAPATSIVVASVVLVADSDDDDANVVVADDGDDVAAIVPTTAALFGANERPWSRIMPSS